MSCMQIQVHMTKFTLCSTKTGCEYKPLILPEKIFGEIETACSNRHFSSVLRAPQMHVSRSTFEHPDATLLQEPMVLAQKSHQIESCLKFSELQDTALQESKKRLPAIFTHDMSVKKESIPSPAAATLIIPPVYLWQFLVSAVHGMDCQLVLQLRKTHSKN
jgi:hypothetical protein